MYLALVAEVAYDRCIEDHAYTAEASFSSSGESLEEIITNMTGCVEDIEDD